MDNLRENINRIQEMMGLITEDNKSDAILNMVNKLGVYQTIKSIGGIKRFMKYLGDTKLPKHNMIDFIKEIVIFWMEVSRQPGFTLSSNYTDEPIDCGSDDEYIRQTQILLKKGALVDVYNNKPLGMLEDTLLVPYEDLPEDSLYKIYEAMVDFIMKYKVTEL